MHWKAPVLLGLGLVEEDLHSTHRLLRLAPALLTIYSLFIFRPVRRLFRITQTHILASCMRTREISESVERRGLSRESSIDLEEQSPCSLWVDTGTHRTALVHQGRDDLSTSWHILELITKHRASLE